MCKYCIEGMEFDASTKIVISGDKLLIDYNTYEVEINFCPMCGRELVSKDN